VEARQHNRLEPSWVERILDRCNRPNVTWTATISSTWTYNARTLSVLPRGETRKRQRCGGSDSIALVTHQQPLTLTEAVDRIENVTFVLANGYSPSLFPPLYKKAKERGWRTIKIACGHDVMLEKPKDSPVCCSSSRSPLPLPLRLDFLEGLLCIGGV
jgi:hypothetical protein